MWETWHDETIEEIHVTPEHDNIQHELNDACICGPTPQLIETDAGDTWMHSHHSLDGREKQEQT